MSNPDLKQLTDSYLNGGGKIKQCADGDTSVRLVPRGLWRCRCGCHGDYTDHSMRAGESGRCASVIIS